MQGITIGDWSRLMNVSTRAHYWFQYIRFLVRQLTLDSASYSANCALYRLPSLGCTPWTIVGEPNGRRFPLSRLLIYILTRALLRYNRLRNLNDGRMARSSVKDEEHSGQWFHGRTVSCYLYYNIVIVSYYLVLILEHSIFFPMRNALLFVLNYIFRNFAQPLALEWRRKFFVPKLQYFLGFKYIQV